MRPLEVWQPLNPAAAPSLMGQAALGTPPAPGQTLSLRKALAIPAGLLVAVRMTPPGLPWCPSISFLPPSLTASSLTTSPTVSSPRNVPASLAWPRSGPKLKSRE